MDGFRELMEQRWQEFEHEASATMSEGNLANVLGQDWYRTLDSNQRSLADQVLGDWVLHGTSRQRLYAISIIWEFGIRSAGPALQQLAAKLDDTPGPAAKDLRETVQRLIDALKGHD